MSRIIYNLLSITLLAFTLNSPVFAASVESNPARALLDIAIKKSDIMNAEEIDSMLASVESKELKKGRVLENNQFRIKLLKEAELNKVVLRYISPKNVEGMAYLSHMDKEEAEQDADDAKIWLYMPALKKTKRVTLSSAQSSLPGIGDSFSQLGDLGEEDDYFYKQLDDELLSGKSHYVVEVKPKDKTTKPALRKVWIDADKELVTKIVTFDDSDTRIEETTIENYKPYLNYWLPANIESMNYETKKESIITYSDIKLNTSLKANSFNVNSLKRAF